jgi:hypothetical protein
VKFKFTEFLLKVKDFLTFFLKINNLTGGEYSNTGKPLKLAVLIVYGPWDLWVFLGICEYILIDDLTHFRAGFDAFASGFLVQSWRDPDRLLDRLLSPRVEFLAEYHYVESHDFFINP